MSEPTVRVPRVHPFLHWLAKFLFRISGWNIEGKLPESPKAVFIAAPHTSYWDGPLMVTGGCLFDVRFNWMVKDAAMFFPLGIIVRYFGGIAIDRSKRNNVVSQSIDEFRKRDAMLLSVAPEGTRGKTHHWKTGFYRIAQGAGVPLVFGYVDYARKVVGIGPTYYPTGDLEADFKVFDDFYSKVTPRHPELRGIVAPAPEKVDRPEDNASLRQAG